MPNPSCTIFVGNVSEHFLVAPCATCLSLCVLQLDYNVTWQKLKDIFKVVGRVVNADILMDHSGKSKGLGEVQFEDPNDAISAIGGLCRL